MLFVKAKLNARDRKAARKRLIIWASVTFFVLAVIFCVIMGIRAKMPMYMISVDGLDASSPAQAQRLCRENYQRFAAMKNEHPNCEFVWCGKNRIYMLLPYALESIPDSENTGFDSVRFYSTGGIKTRGYIIRPELPNQELGIIDLVNGNRFDFESVSMSVRVGLRKGEIPFNDAVFIWEKDSKKVFAVKKTAVFGQPGADTQFVDDGGVIRNCVILDTRID